MGWMRHTQTPIPTSPKPQPLPRSSSRQDGLGTRVTKLEMWEFCLSPSPSGLQPRKTPLCREQQGWDSNSCVPQALGQPRSSSQPSSGCRESGKHGRDGNGRENHPPSQGGSAGWEPGMWGIAPSSPSIPTGMFRDAPAPSNSRNCIPSLNPWL